MGRFASWVTAMIPWVKLLGRVYLLYPMAYLTLLDPQPYNPAMCLVIGHKLPLCPTLVTGLCSGHRSHIVGGQEANPSMIFYAWYCLHCDAPSQCRNFPRPPFHRHLKSNSFHFTTKGIHYQFIGRIPRDPNDCSKVHGELASNGTGTLWLKCTRRPSLLVFCNEELMELKPYYPSQFTSQFGYSQGTLSLPWIEWGIFLKLTHVHFKSLTWRVLFSYPWLFERPVLSHAFCIWYSMSTK